MRVLADLLVGLVAAAHLFFAWLEMFAWRTPRGLRVFGMTAAQAQASATLASNQGLYNAVLAAGLVASFFVASNTALTLRLYVLAAIAVVGLYGAWTVSPRVFFFQPLPALLALAAVWAAR
jgi:putative membrane protein